MCGARTPACDTPQILTKICGAENPAAVVGTVWTPFWPSVAILTPF